MLRVRPAREGDDDLVRVALAEWMSPERAVALAPHVAGATSSGTAFVVQDESGSVAGFVVGFVEPDAPGVGYVHFVWVSPEHRGHGVARALYEHLFEALRAAGCREVRAVVSERSKGARAFHDHLGFRPAADTGLEVTHPLAGSGAVLVLGL